MFELSGCAGAFLAVEAFHPAKLCFFTSPGPPRKENEDSQLTSAQLDMLLRTRMSSVADAVSILPVCMTTTDNRMSDWLIRGLYVPYPACAQPPPRRQFFHEVHPESHLLLSVDGNLDNHLVLDNLLGPQGFKVWVWVWRR